MHSSLDSTLEPWLAEEFFHSGRSLEATQSTLCAFGQDHVANQFGASISLYRCQVWVFHDPPGVNLSQAEQLHVRLGSDDKIVDFP